MLSGHWPYWSPEKTDKHPDELLRARLHHADHSKSLIEQDLFELADGLEGRSTNPVSLLLDSLQHPMADLGMEMPCMLEYRYHPEKEVSTDSKFSIRKKTLKTQFKPLALKLKFKFDKNFARGKMIMDHSKTCC